MALSFLHPPAVLSASRVLPPLLADGYVQLSFPGIYFVSFTAVSLQLSMQRLVVAFRGSVGTKHWMDNLRYADRA